MLLMKIFVLICIFFALVEGEPKYAVGRLFEKPGCNIETSLAWSAVELDRCYTEGSGIYGLKTKSF